MGAAYFDPKKARRNARRQAEKKQSGNASSFPSRTKPSIRFLANNATLFYDPVSGFSCIMLNADALAKKIDFAPAERMTRKQAHGVVSLIDDAPESVKAEYHALIDAPTDADTDAKNENLK